MNVSLHPVIYLLSIFASLAASGFVHSEEISVEGLRDLLKQGAYAEVQEQATAHLAAIEVDQGRQLEKAETLDVLVEARWRSGKAQNPESRRLGEQAVEAKKELLGPDHPEVAKSLDNLGVLLFISGNYADSMPLLRRALDIQTAALKPDDPDIAKVLNHLAVLRQTIGEYSKALPLYERALLVQEQAYGLEHVEVAKTLNNLATLRKAMGDYDAAVPLYYRALKILGAQLGTAHALIGIGESNLGELHHQLGNFTQALGHYERAVQIKEQTLGLEHPSLAITLSNLGQLLYRQQDFHRSRSLHERALNIQEGVLGPDHPEVANTLNNLGQVLAQLGSDGVALELYQRALSIREKSFGAEHPLVADSQSRLALLFFSQGDNKEALDTALRAEAISRDHLRLTAVGLAERQALSYATERTSTLDLILSLISRDVEGQSSKTAWDVVVRSRALVLDEISTRNRIAHTRGNAKTHTLTQAYRDKSERLANLLVGGPGMATPSRYRELVREARVEQERAERILASHSTSLLRELSSRKVGLAEVTQAVPKRSALVAYVRYQALTPGAQRAPLREPSTDSRNPRAPSSQASYLAFVFTGQARGPVMISLGTAAKIEAHIRRWREQAVRSLQFPGEQVDDAEASYKDAAQALREMIWDPVARELESAKRIFIVPDGALHLVDVAALPSDDGRYLVEARPVLHYLSAERDIVSYQREASRDDSGTFLVMDSPNYDAELNSPRKGRKLTSAISPIPALFRGGLHDCANFQSHTFEPLPASEQEGQMIENFFQNTRGDAPGNVLRLSGSVATEAAFKRYAPASRTLHLATHGFFLAGECASDQHGDSPAGSGTENPLLLSGLALAGANRRRSGDLHEEDGIITAREVAALDLTRVRWAVLSGCDTGLGKILAGEGVLGLRRAFQVAGAGTLIMSLWPVEDRVTREWMTALYKARLVKRLPTAEAVRTASLALLKEARKHGHSTHPFYWAGFVATGDWR